MSLAAVGLLKWRVATAVAEREVGTFEEIWTMCAAPEELRWYRIGASAFACSGIDGVMVTGCWFVELFP